MTLQKKLSDEKEELKDFKVIIQVRANTYGITQFKKLLEEKLRRTGIIHKISHKQIN